MATAKYNFWQYKSRFLTFSRLDDSKAAALLKGDTRPAAELEILTLLSEVNKDWINFKKTVIDSKVAERDKKEEREVEGSSWMLVDITMDTMRATKK
jgi:hypothetical protein